MDRLRTTGIIVQGVGLQGSNRQEMKPILMMHLKDVGLILLCLLFYLPRELFAFLGGKRVLKESDEILLYPHHNLPVGPGEEVLGGVSKFFSLEDFMKNSAVGSFLKSRCVSSCQQARNAFAS